MPISTDDMIRARLKLRDDGLVATLCELEEPEPALYGFIACSLHCLQIHLAARGIPPLGARDVVGEITETILTTVIALREEQTDRRGTPGRN